MSLLSKLLPAREGAQGVFQIGSSPRVKPLRVTTKEAERAMREDLPDTAYLNARTEYFNATGAVVVQRARLWLLLVLSMLLVLVMAFTIQGLFPLKTVQPWIIKVDENRGTVEIDRSAAVQPTLSAVPRPVLERELSEWIRALWSINGDYPAITKEQQEAAYIKTRDRATTEYLDFLKREQIYARMKYEPGLVRTVERSVVSFRSEEGVAMVRFTTQERTRVAPEAKRREWVMLLQYKLEPQSSAEEVKRNPLGLYLFHFEITEER